MIFADTKIGDIISFTNCGDDDNRLFIVIPQFENADGTKFNVAEEIFDGGGNPVTHFYMGNPYEKVHLIERRSGNKP